MLECPSHSLTCLIGIFASKQLVANVCRKLCIVIFCIFVFLRIFEKLVFIGFSVILNSLLLCVFSIAVANGCFNGLKMGIFPPLPLNLSNTQVLVFNPFQYSYKVYPCQQLTNFSDVTNYFFLFDKE